MEMHEPTPLVLGGVSIRQRMGVGPIRQRYEPIGGSSMLRLSGGTGIKMTNWSRTATTASGSGYLGPGLDALDYSQPLELLCVAPREMIGTSPLFSLPAAEQRRPDVAPWGWALIGSNWRDTPVQMAGDAAELEAVPGASAYRVFWLPRLVVFTSGITSEFDEATGLHDWSLAAEEI
ncbi:hypothetical protein IB256_04045 [Pseudomonas sp. PDM17]|uniref:hypothetical protein n=1 Tax=Pseudomonas sp. PDM17 TaxID=2769285 RepID=UPI001783B073|nr:hypothetical protein [Pseudomonas sp. PDM17]MBD9499938.1 hypothetical protein [Pseudomonas sp. PDM17]